MEKVNKSYQQLTLKARIITHLEELENQRTFEII